MTTLVPFNDLARASRSQEGSLLGILSDVVSSGWYVKGPRHDEFEDALGAYLHVPHVVAVGNGTDALELALRSVATDQRSVVVTVANAGGYTSCAARAAGLEVRYCDIDPDTHCLDPEALEGLLDDQVCAVVVTHLYGRFADVDGVLDRCRGLGIRVIEDCAQAIGARDAAGMAGARGDLATFSFYPTKNLGALGDGGAVATADAMLAGRIRALSQYGWGRGKYQVTVAGGRNSRLDELQAAVLTYRLALVDEGNERRREIVRRYVAAAPASIRVLPAVSQAHVAHLAVVEVSDAVAFASHLKACGVGTAVHYPVPDHRQPAYGEESVSLPVTESMMGRVLSIPCFPELTDEEIDIVARSLATYSGPSKGSF